ncbi:MAG TPA: S66 peptidase family protein [Egibacteraceae bacterium]|nr:S66 peptidase family protein [Egibacteraceae bacterium]
MTVRFPEPLQPGDLIGVTSPSSGVPEALRPRLELCLEHLRAQGYRARVGECMSGAGVVSAPAGERAAELTAMLLDPQVRAVVPPWGGELAVEVLPHLDLDALRQAEPTWVVGYSDLSTVLLPLTVTAGWATLHGHNLLDSPYRSPEPLAHWLDVVTLPRGDSVTQGASRQHRAHGHDDWEDDPAVVERTWDSTGGWQPLDERPVRASGRLVGGCIETVSVLAGTPYGDVRAFAEEHAPEGLVLHLEAAEEPALAIARHLWRMRLAGWFDHANAVLVGRTTAPDSDGFTQRDAVRSVLGDLDVPVVLDVDCGHVPPHLSLVGGALAEVVVDGDVQQLRQLLA